MMVNNPPFPPSMVMQDPLRFLTLKDPALYRTQGTRQIPAEDCKTAYPSKNTADFLHGSGIPGAPVFL